MHSLSLLHESTWSRCFICISTCYTSATLSSPLLHHGVLETWKKTFPWPLSPKQEHLQEPCLGNAYRTGGTGSFIQFSPASQCFPTLTLRKVFLIPSLNLPCSSPGSILPDICQVPSGKEITH